MKFRNSLLLFIVALFANNLVAQDSVFTNSIGMEFVLIKPGSFVVGKFQPPYPKSSKQAEALAKRDSRKGFTVALKKSFSIGRFEVTQEQWKKVMGTNPSVFHGDNHPIENVTWNDVQLFLEKLNQLDKERTYRLPTEFEWEFAARAGSTEDISWDEIRATAQMGLKTTAVVGKKKPNAWGIYDM